MLQYDYQLVFSLKKLTIDTKQTLFYYHTKKFLK